MGEETPIRVGRIGKQRSRDLVVPCRNVVLLDPRDFEGLTLEKGSNETHKKKVKKLPIIRN